MKLKMNFLRTGALLSTVGVLNAQDAPSGESGAHGDPFTPVGELSVTPTVVQPGVHPEMFWVIDYPQTIPDMVIIDNAGGMTTLNEKTDLYTLRIAGMAEGSENAAVWVRINSGPWNLVFYGTEANVDPGSEVFSINIGPGTKIDLAARGSNGGTWLDVQWTLNQAASLEALIDESPLPAAITNSGAESFMTQYVGPNNEVVAGPRDVIHVFELESEDPNSSDYNLQDIVVVSTFGKTNNGHGNNEDGFDSTNPGDSSGVGGVEDSSYVEGADGEILYYIDDEKEKILAK